MAPKPRSTPGVDQGVPAEKNVKILAPGKAQIFFGIGEIAGGVLDTHDISISASSPPWPGSRRRWSWACCCKIITGRSVAPGDGPVELIELGLGLGDEQRSEHRNGVDAGLFADFPRRTAPRVVMWLAPP
jgi:hypothetical protein